MKHIYSQCHCYVSTLELLSRYNSWIASKTRLINSSTQRSYKSINVTRRRLVFEVSRGSILFKFLFSTKAKLVQLTHWGRVTHICVVKLTIIGSDTGLSPGRRQAIIWTNTGMLLIGPLGTNFIEILIRIQIFSFRKMHLKMSSARCRPFCLGLNVLNVSYLCYETRSKWVHEKHRFFVLFFLQSNVYFIFYIIESIIVVWLLSATVDHYTVPEFVIKFFKGSYWGIFVQCQHVANEYKHTPGEFNFSKIKLKECRPFCRIICYDRSVYLYIHNC